MKRLLTWIILFLSCLISLNAQYLYIQRHGVWTSEAVCAQTGPQNDNQVFGRLELQITYDNDDGGWNGGSFSHTVSLPAGFVFPTSNIISRHSSWFISPPSVSRLSSRRIRISSGDLTFGSTGGSISVFIDVVQAPFESSYCINKSHVVQGLSGVGDRHGGGSVCSGSVFGTPESPSWRCSYCAAGSSRPVLSDMSAQICQGTTFDLTTINASNKPSAATLTWHTGSTASNANKVSSPTGVGTGTYYAAFYSASEDCYNTGGTTSFTISSKVCTDSDGDGVFNENDLDDDNDGILDVNEIPTCTSETVSKAGVSVSSGIAWSGGLANILDGTSNNEAFTSSNGTNIANQTYLQFQFPSAQKLNAIELQAHSNGILNTGAQLIVQGSNDGANWTNLSPTITTTGLSTGVITGTASCENFEFTNNESFTFYRLRGVSGTTIWWYLQEVAFRGVASCDFSADIDGDGIDNYLDLDSDGDGCPDALEGSGTIVSSNLVASSMNGGNSGAQYNGTSTDPVTENLGTNVDANGIPLVIPGGQTIGEALDPNTASCSIQLNIKAYLQGAFMGDTYGIYQTNGLMRDDLRVQNLIPTQEPYSGLAYVQIGSGGETVESGAFDNRAANSVVDWVRIELRNAGDPTIIEQTLNLLLQRDGNIVGLDGQSLPSVSADLSGTSFYIAIRHRNHLGVMTKNPILFSQSGVNFDFTNPTESFYSKEKYVNGGTMRFNGMEQSIIQNRSVLWAGNTNGDDRLKVQGARNDVNQILQDVALAQNQQSFVYNYDNAVGYFNGDVNMDGKVKYQGSNNDVEALLKQIMNIPTNSKHQYAFDFFLEQIP